METSILEYWHPRSRGYNVDPVAVLFPRIMVGPAEYLTPAFVHHHNITHVINCAERGLTPSWLVKRLLPTRYMNIPTQDAEAFPLLQVAYTHFENVMTHYLRDTSCGCVYVHCAAGVNRSATLAHAYVCKQFRVPLPKLLDVSMRQRPCMLQNPGFVHQLIQFAKKHT